MNRRPWLRRHPFLGLLGLFLLALLAWAWQARQALEAFPDILSAYTAKEYCSCRYVMRHPAAYCQGYVRQYLPLSGLRDDPATQQVTASGLGRSHGAAWLGERVGCRLVE